MQIEELCAAEREAEDFLVREAEGGAASGGSLSERETKDIWSMLHADRVRILDLSKRVEVARRRLEAARRSAGRD